MNDEIPLTLYMPPDLLLAMALLLKRLDYNTCVKLAGPVGRFGNRCEADVMWSAVCELRRQLAEAGFAPR